MIDLFDFTTDPTPWNEPRLLPNDITAFGYNEETKTLWAINHHQQQDLLPRNIWLSPDDLLRLDTYVLSLVTGGVLDTGGITHTVSCITEDQINNNFYCHLPNVLRVWNDSEGDQHILRYDGSSRIIPAHLLD